MKSDVQMRVIHTIPSIVNKLNGPSYSVTRLCEALKSCGCIVTLASLSENKCFHEMDYIKYFSRGSLPARLGSSSELKHWLDREAGVQAIDILHNHSLWMMPNVYPGWVAKKYRLPLITSPRGTLSHRAMNSGLKYLKKILRGLRGGGSFFVWIFNPQIKLKWRGLTRLALMCQEFKLVLPSLTAFWAAAW